MADGGALKGCVVMFAEGVCVCVCVGNKGQIDFRDGVRGQMPRPTWIEGDARRRRMMQTE